LVFSHGLRSPNMCRRRRPEPAQLGEHLFIHSVCHEWYCCGRPRARTNAVSIVPYASNRRTSDDLNKNLHHALRFTMTLYYSDIKISQTFVIAPKRLRISDPPCSWSACQNLRLASLSRGVCPIGRSRSPPDQDASHPSGQRAGRSTYSSISIG
jgi:hypothetical protein